MISHIYRRCYFFSYNTLVIVALDVLPFLQLMTSTYVGFFSLSTYKSFDRKKYEFAKLTSIKIWTMVWTKVKKIKD
jgi:hypothetical protein